MIRLDGKWRYIYNCNVIALLARSVIVIDSIRSGTENVGSALPLWKMTNKEVICDFQTMNVIIGNIHLVF